MENKETKKDELDLEIIRQLARDIFRFEVTLGDEAKDENLELEKAKLANDRYKADLQFKQAVMSHAKAEEQDKKAYHTAENVTNKAEKVIEYVIVFRDRSISTLKISETMHRSIAQNAARANSTDHLIHANDGEEILSIRTSDILYIKKV